VAVQRDVERADQHLERAVALVGAQDALAESAGQEGAARRDAEEHDVGGAEVALDDLVRDARGRAGDVAGVEDDALAARFGTWACGGARSHPAKPPSPPLRTGLKVCCQSTTLPDRGPRRRCRRDVSAVFLATREGARSG